MSNRKEKKEEHREGTQTRKHPNGYTKLEVFEKAATKKDDHNHHNQPIKTEKKKRTLHKSHDVRSISAGASLASWTCS